MKNIVRSQSLKFFGFCPCLTVRLDPEECDKDDKREEDDEADEQVPDQLRSFLGCKLSDLHSLLLNELRNSPFLAWEQVEELNWSFSSCSSTHFPSPISLARFPDQKIKYCCLVCYLEILHSSSPLCCHHLAHLWHLKYVLLRQGRGERIPAKRNGDNQKQILVWKNIQAGMWKTPDQLGSRLGGRQQRWQIETTQSFLGSWLLTLTCFLCHNIAARCWKSLRSTSVSVRNAFKIAWSVAAAVASVELTISWSSLPPAPTPAGCW